MAASYPPDKYNATSYDALAMAIITLQAFAGTWINAFIVSVLCVAWVTKKSLNSNEKILLLLGCSRFGDLCITWVYSFLAILYPWCFYVHPIPQLFSALQGFLNTAGVWVSACLCVFYCIKIANFRHSFFIYLKLRIDRIVPWLLLGSGLLSLVMSILAYAINDRAVSQYLNSTSTINLWQMRVRMDEHLFPLFFINGFILTSAFMTVIFSAVLLLFSLWRHKRKMQTASVKNLSMDAHIKAIKSILSFLFIYSINYTGFILILIYTVKNQIITTFLVLILQCALPVVHSLVLIFSNPKLEKTLLRILSSVKRKLGMG